ncbi:MAG: phenylalanine--tRNA ligase subunit alpha [Proteobacteria bacterium]|nr:phenylalanine--tRNA ligase subunit alpha [Pseudomonadota bacterium]
MIEQINQIRVEAHSQIFSALDPDALDRLRVHYMGKKGVLTTLLHQLKELTPEKRKEMGAVLNEVKTNVERDLKQRQTELKRVVLDKEISSSGSADVSLPGHFAELEFYHLEALNTTEDHPARDMQDTFYINPPVLLRSHTSPVQIRTMKDKKPPIQIIAPGKVYRSDYDLTHTPMFHQIEGLMVDENLSLADLKGVLNYLIKNLFGTKTLRFRPSFFPFTEPSAEVDMQCIQCKGKGCRLCKSTGWLEIGGCGMVHPNVFKSVNYDSEKYSGFAFGMGIERIAMLKYGIDDLRSFFENDIRMLEQF